MGNKSVSEMPAEIMLVFAVFGSVEGIWALDIKKEKTKKTDKKCFIPRFNRELQITGK
jgi:hypothetical protein